MIPQHVALLICAGLTVFCLLGYAFAHADGKAERTKSLWLCLAIFWGLPVLVPIYVSAWLGS